MVGEEMGQCGTGLVWGWRAWESGMWLLSWSVWEEERWRGGGRRWGLGKGVLEGGPGWGEVDLEGYVEPHGRVSGTGPLWDMAGGGGWP